MIDMLKRFGFGSKWISWMEECISTSCFFILVNNIPNCFVETKEIGQSDLPPPSLLLLSCKVSVFCLLSRFICGFCIATSYLFTTHLHLANVRIILVKDVEKQFTEISFFHWVCSGTSSFPIP